MTRNKLPLFGGTLGQRPGFLVGRNMVREDEAKVLSTHMTSFEELQSLLDVDPPTPAAICDAIAKIFEVRSTEVGLLLVDGEFLKFLFPVELQAAGVIPLSSSAVAARSAAAKQAVLFNRFPHVPHHTVFEQIKLNDAKPLAELPDPIQKLMSAPVMGEDGLVMGVLQVSRKGMTPGIAGADFTGADLRLLERVARRVALMMPEFAPSKPPMSGSLRFNNVSKRASA
jgi:GAF domain